VGRARCRKVTRSRAAQLQTIWVVLASWVALAAALVGCSEPVSERFTVQAEGERYFLRERRGWFSAMFPCKPEFAKAKLATDKIRMVVAACVVDGETFSITFGRFKVSAAESASLDRIYDQVINSMGNQVPGAAAGRVKIESITVAGRPARYVSYQNVANTGASAHIWILWAEEQQAIYQILQIGDQSPAAGQRIIRSMQVPSP
jgi:hypothetical protein